MPRRPRIHLDGVPLHIVQRGHNRQPSFFAVADYLAYLDALADAAHRTGCQIHADVLMTNHVHLLLTPGDAQAVSQMMVALGSRYVPYVNAAYQRSGTLWEGRFFDAIEQATGQRREAKPRGRPRKLPDADAHAGHPKQLALLRSL
jgi:putative transposase